jgi:RHS repeat-associated protein
LSDSRIDPGFTPVKFDLDNSGELVPFNTYDFNGNLLTDDRKPTSITYNYLNLAQTVTQTSTNQQLNYIYTADGEKLRKVLNGSTRDYVDGIEYNNGAIEFVPTEEGRAIPGTNYFYEYELTDHLGNTRAIVGQDGTIKQVQDYYAFGMDMNTGNSLVPSPDNRYKYNGLEYTSEFNLNQYDYGARNYDPAIGRWTGMDLLAESHYETTPYNYTLNNPINFRDEMRVDTVPVGSQFIHTCDYSFGSGSCEL